MPTIIGEQRKGPVRDRSSSKTVKSLISPGAEIIEEDARLEDNSKSEQSVSLSSDQESKAESQSQSSQKKQKIPFINVKALDGGADLSKSPMKDQLSKKETLQQIQQARRSSSIKIDPTGKKSDNILTQGRHLKLSDEDDHFREIDL